jgi:hypothetical protein
MSQYVVRCRNAAGIPRDVAIVAKSSAAAIRQALRQVNADYPGEGWVAQWAL